MGRYFFDSYPIIEMILGNENFAGLENVKIVTTVLNMMEVDYFLLREFNRETAVYWMGKLDVELINIIRLDVALEAVRFRFLNKKEKLSYVDCLGYVMARKFKMKFLTGDVKFENKDNVEFVK